MNGSSSPTADRVISCALAIGVLCLALLILGVILMSVGTP
jgi:uncharacterized membrane protein